MVDAAVSGLGVHTGLRPSEVHFVKTQTTSELEIQLVNCMVINLIWAQDGALKCLDSRWMACGDGYFKLFPYLRTCIKFLSSTHKKKKSNVRVRCKMNTQAKMHVGVGVSLPLCATQTVEISNDTQP